MAHAPTERLDPDAIARLLLPYVAEVPQALAEGLSVYLELLLKWNARTNLTAIRDPEAMVQRHFGESLFLARHVPAHARALLDLGSGAGFPGIPVQLARPDLSVTLAESQGKKAAFLREAVRTLGLGSKVHGDRAEKLAGMAVYDVVTMRAVDDPEAAQALALRLLAPGGTLLHLTSVTGSKHEGANEVSVPGRNTSILRIVSG